jgi:hypothetical protein
MTVPADLPKNAKRRAVQPPGLPEGDDAWTQHDALGVLETLAGSIIAVIQVDVYVVPFGHREVIHTGRRASYSYNAGELAFEFAQRSRQLAEEFIKAGSSDELFVLVFSRQDDAEVGRGTFSVRAG